MNSELEQTLVADFIATKSEAAFRKLYRLHAHKLYALAMHLCSYEEQAAQDLVQETWVNAIRALPGFRNESGLRTWLSSIAINCYRQLKRKEKKRDENDTIKINKTGDHPTAIDIKIDLRRALGQLPDGYREVLILHDFEGLTHKEIGELLGITDGTSKSQLSHARKAVRQLLQYN